MAEEFNGQSHYERTEHEASNKAKKVNPYQWNAGTLQWEKVGGVEPNYVLFDPNDATPTYIGLNSSVLATTSQTDWTIYKFTYSSGDVTQIKKNTGAWTNRAGLF